MTVLLRTTFIYKVIDRRIDRRYMYYTEDRKIRANYKVPNSVTSSYKIVNNRRIDRICLYHTEGRKMKANYKVPSKQFLVHRLCRYVLLYVSGFLLLLLPV